jgi:acetyltransferase-like isoleucine patch superfamily enzyme
MSLRSALVKVRIAMRRLSLPRGLRAGNGAFVRAPFSIPYGEGISLGVRTTIHEHAVIALIKRHGVKAYSSEIIIGDDVYIGRHLFLTALNRVSIGNGCVLSDHVYINDASHGMNISGAPILDQPLESKGPIDIGPRCFLGYRCAILPGVTLGQGCVVGINSVVTRSYPEYSMLAGVPATLIRTFDHVSQTWVAVASKDRHAVASQA